MIETRVESHKIPTHNRKFCVIHILPDFNEFPSNWVSLLAVLVVVTVNLGSAAPGTGVCSSLFHAAVCGDNDIEHFKVISSCVHYINACHSSHSCVTLNKYDLTDNNKITNDSNVVILN